MKQIRSLLSLLTTWVGAIGWHLLMVARLRPQVALVNDGPLAFLSFFFPYLIAGELRWHVMYGKPIEEVALNLIATIVIVRFLSCWGPWRLVSMYLAISTVVDIAAVFLVLVGVPAVSLRTPWTQIVEALMFLNLCHAWKQGSRSV